MSVNSNVCVLYSGQLRSWAQVIDTHLELFKQFKSIKVFAHFWDDEDPAEIQSFYNCLNDVSNIEVTLIVESIDEQLYTKYVKRVASVGYMKNSIWMLSGMTSVFRNSDVIRSNYDRVIRLRYDIRVMYNLTKNSDADLLMHMWANEKVFFDGFFVLSGRVACKFYENLLENFFALAESHQVEAPEFIISYLLHNAGATNFASDDSRAEIILINGELGPCFYQHKNRTIFQKFKSDMAMIIRVNRGGVSVLNNSSLNQYLFGNFFYRAILLIAVFIRNSYVYQAIR